MNIFSARSVWNGFTHDRLARLLSRRVTLRILDRGRASVVRPQEQIYVVDLVQCVKVGRSHKALMRVFNHMDQFGINWGNYWLSPWTHRAIAMETTLIREVGELYPVWRYREYFDADYKVVLAMAQDIAARKEFQW